MTHTFWLMQTSSFEGSSEILRGHAYQATTPVDEYIGLMKGLSAKIIRIGHDVKKPRSSLIVSRDSFFLQAC